jgi:ribulose-phosphate 3-epimerase
MYKQPFVYVENFLALGPQLVIIHAEAEGDFNQFASLLHAHGVEVGVALLATTPTSLIESSLASIDHVLVFSGNLGYYGGQADLNLLSKVQRLKSLKPQLEIGWDGGVNDTNARALADGGVDVLNVGSYISRADNPDEAYATLEEKLK